MSFIDRKNSVNEDQIKTIKPLILSTMPVDRAEVLGILASKCGLTATEISKELRKSSKTIRRTMKELEALDIVDCYKDSKYTIPGKAPWSYFIRDEFASLLEAPIPSQECLSQSKRTMGEVYSVEDDDLDIPF